MRTYSNILVCQQGEIVFAFYHISELCPDAKNDYGYCDIAHAFRYLYSLEQTWAKYGPPVLLFWPASTYTNLNSHREFSGGPFFPFEIMDGSDFQKISLNGAKF